MATPTVTYIVLIILDGGGPRRSRRLETSTAHRLRSTYDTTAAPALAAPRVRSQPYGLLLSPLGRRWHRQIALDDRGGDLLRARQAGERSLDAAHALLGGAEL